jgi:hypothetical protein
MEQYAWYQHYSYLLNKEDIFEIFFPGRSKTNRGEGLHNDVIIITSKKGAGKTSLAKMLMYIFSQHEPDDKFTIFCGVPGLYSDMKEVIGEKRLLEVDLEEIEIEGDFEVPPISYFENMFVLFDDTEKHESKEIEKMLWRLVNSLAQKGRNYRVTLLCILHQINKGITSTTVLREMDAMIIFPKFFDMNTYNTIINHIGLPRNITEALYKLNEVFILIRNSAPQYFFLGTSMTKTGNFNKILRLAYGDMEGGYEDVYDNNDEQGLNELLNLINIGQNGTNNRQRTNIGEDVEEDNKPEDHRGKFKRL